MHAVSPKLSMQASAQRASLVGSVSATRQRVVVTLCFAVIVVAVLLALWPTTQSMGDVWLRSSAYHHCFAVIPIAVWMAWRQSAATALPSKPFWPAMVLIAAVGFIWLVGEIAGVAVVAHFAAIGLVVATAITVLGVGWARHLAFPLGFLFFAVPFGEALLPLLMDRTADVTVWALRASGIPVYREGNDFVVPSGSWSVIEACGGIRFLIAALMSGCIFAWLQYRSASKRLVFVCAALVAALIANWLRAYAMVMLGHFSDNRIGTGGDHSTWGWLIFGGAMFVLFAAGMRWSDQEQDSTATAHAGVEPPLSLQTTTALAASVLLVMAWPTAARWIEAGVDTRPVRVEAIAPRGGWQPALTAVSEWTPELVAPAATHVQTFVRAADAVSVYLGVYRGQRQDSEVVNTLNRIASSDSARWRVLQRGPVEVDLNGQSTVVRTAVVRSARGQIVIWQWYWIDGLVTSSDVRVKARLAAQRLRGQTDTAAWVAVYTQADDRDAATRRLTDFVKVMAGPMDRALAATAER